MTCEPLYTQMCVYMCVYIYIHIYVIACCYDMTCIVHVVVHAINAQTSTNNAQRSNEMAMPNSWKHVWQGMARHGTAQHGTARHGTARHGTARHGTARHGTARSGFG